MALDPIQYHNREKRDEEIIQKMMIAFPFLGEMSL